MLRLSLFTIIMVFISKFTFAVSAPNYECVSSNITRKVEVIYEDVRSTLPCSVRYHKDDENMGIKTLWRAENTSGYCESKAEMFVDKLRSFGWSCDLVQNFSNKEKIKINKQDPSKIEQTNK